MTIQPARPAIPLLACEPHNSSSANQRQLESAAASQSGELREVFNQFVGETFYGQMLKAMRQTVPKPAYFHGGRAEEAFQGQLDQVLAEKMSHSTADSFAQAMFELSHLPRPG
jgi:Rod binding domain-containing protein